MQFFVGKYYRCVLEARGPGWNNHGYMDGVLGKDKVLCIKTIPCFEDEYARYALFDGLTINITRPDGMWSWRPDEFVEVVDLPPSPPIYIQHDLEL